jgi:hypothetical protein
MCAMWLKLPHKLMESDITEQRFIVNAENVMYRDFLQTIGAGLNVQGPTVKAGKKSFCTRLESGMGEIAF